MATSIGGGFCPGPLGWRAGGRPKGPKAAGKGATASRPAPGSCEVTPQLWPYKATGNLPGLRGGGWRASDSSAWSGTSITTGRKIAAQSAAARRRRVPADASSSTNSTPVTPFPLSEPAAVVPRQLRAPPGSPGTAARRPPPTCAPSAAASGTAPACSCPVASQPRTADSAEAWPHGQGMTPGPCGAQPGGALAVTGRRGASAVSIGTQGAPPTSACRSDQTRVFLREQQLCDPHTPLSLVSFVVGSQGQRLCPSSSRCLASVTVCSSFAHSGAMLWASVTGPGTAGCSRESDRRGQAPALSGRELSWTDKRSQSLHHRRGGRGLEAVPERSAEGGEGGSTTGKARVAQGEGRAAGAALEPGPRRISDTRMSADWSAGRCDVRSLGLDGQECPVRGSGHGGVAGWAEEVALAPRGGRVREEGCHAGGPGRPGQAELRDRRSRPAVNSPRRLSAGGQVADRLPRGFCWCPGGGSQGWDQTGRLAAQDSVLPTATRDGMEGGNPSIRRGGQKMQGSPETLMKISLATACLLSRETSGCGMTLRRIRAGVPRTTFVGPVPGRTPAAGMSQETKGRRQRDKRLLGNTSRRPPDHLLSSLCCFFIIIFFFTVKIFGV